MVKVLVVEDHESLCKSLGECLAKEGYQVETAASLAAARQKIGFAPDLILLDWMLGDGQGVDFLSDLRRQGSQVPVIFLTARADVVDKVLGLEMGASDYLTKPFESRELLARIRVRLRESGGNGTVAESPTRLTVGALVIDRTRHRVLFRDKTIDLVKKEFDLLLLLAENPERVFSRDEILNKVWGYDVFPSTRTVDTHILQLRQKTDDQLIETVRSVGYRLRVL